MPRLRSRNLLLAPLLAAFGVLPLQAQAALLGPGAAFVSGGVARIATGELDARLAANGHPTFGRTAGSVGLGAYRIVKGRVLLGGEFNGLVIGEKAHAGREVGVGGGYATLGIGYVANLARDIRVYPRLGVGAGGLALWTQSADTVDFDDVLANPEPVVRRERVLSRDGGVVDVGAGVEFLPRRGKGALIGVRLGYLAAAFGSSSNWQLQDGVATRGPSASIAGPYARVTIGGAWSR